MLKRCLILPFLMLAYTIVLAHSIVPHHHHHELPTEKHHHDEADEHVVSLIFPKFKRVINASLVIAAGYYHERGACATAIYLARSKLIGL